MTLPEIDENEKLYLLSSPYLRVKCEREKTVLRVANLNNLPMSVLKLAHIHH